MQDRPTARELLEAIADLLEGDVLQATQGGLRHSVRVAGNLCRILERELALGSEHDRRELELLEQVLGEAAAGRTADELSKVLVEELRRSSPELEQRAWPALVEIVRGKLAIAKPGHDAYDFAREVPRDGS